jgi:hypothetical protein
MFQRAGFLILSLVALSLVPAQAQAELRSLEVIRREPFAGGMSFGNTGPYEIITAVARFEVDPRQERNQLIIDLDAAPRGPGGKVEFASDVVILAPRDASRGNGAILYDVNNRGNKLALRFFNGAPGSNQPREAAHAGDGFLFRRGYTVVWSGWLGELLPGDGRLLLQAPIALHEGRPIRGIVRYEMSTDTPAETMPLARREGHGSYPPTERGEAEGLLTWRMRETEPRVPIPREQWSLARMPIPSVEHGVPGTLPQVRLRVSGGFRPGYLYELICEAEGPIVQGLGYASVRDLISFLRHDASNRNPLVQGKGQSPIHRVHGFGVSQSGRFLRNFLYLGFNADEQGREVFDGVMPHVSGGGLGFFNHRFAQPTRHNGQHLEHLYPGDYFPFTYGDAVDPFTNRSDGILRRTATEDVSLLPKIMHTQGTGEYWHRSGSLVHTDPLGQRDAEIPEHVRIYTFGGTQHSAAANPPDRGVADNLLNPADYRPFLKALLDSLDAWVRDGATPPASVYPRIDQGTLVDWRQDSTRFPSIPGVRYPEVIQRPPCLDYGPDFHPQGIISIEPPKPLGEYRVLVPKCGSDGNELGALLLPEVAVPLATYTGWNLRRAESGAEGMLVGLMGSYIPLPSTRDERHKSGDPRASLEERYGSFDGYRQQFAAECQRLAAERYLLSEDAQRLISEREKVRERFVVASDAKNASAAAYDSGVPMSRNRPPAANP